jgi:hypothetical protein
MIRPGSIFMVLALPSGYVFFWCGMPSIDADMIECHTYIGWMSYVIYLRCECCIDLCFDHHCYFVLFVYAEATCPPSVKRPVLISRYVRVHLAHNIYHESHHSISDDLIHVQRVLWLAKSYITQSLLTNSFTSGIETMGRISMYTGKCTLESLVLNWRITMHKPGIKETTRLEQV